MEVIYNPHTPSQLTEKRVRSPQHCRTLAMSCGLTWTVCSHLQAVHLLTENTPNGKKVQILLEELRAEYGFEWETHLIAIETDEQKKDWFLALNPNGPSTPPTHTQPNISLCLFHAVTRPNPPSLASP